jgi:hypothetical protein
MFSIFEPVLRVVHDLGHAQANFFTHWTQATFDASVGAAEHHVDAVKALLATSTVAARQWQLACNASRMVPLAAPTVLNAGTAA